MPIAKTALVICQYFYDYDNFSKVKSSIFLIYIGKINVLSCIWTTSHVNDLDLIPIRKEDNLFIFEFKYFSIF